MICWVVTSHVCNFSCVHIVTLCWRRWVPAPPSPVYGNLVSWLKMKLCNRVWRFISSCFHEWTAAALLCVSGLLVSSLTPFLMRNVTFLHSLLITDHFGCSSRCWNPPSWFRVNSGTIVHVYPERCRHRWSFWFTGESFPVSLFHMFASEFILLCSAQLENTRPHL